MYKVIKTGSVLFHQFRNNVAKSIRVTYDSPHWKVWRAIITPGTCAYCFSMNGRILSESDPRVDSIPVHPNCKCYIETLKAILAGTATSAGVNGVDLYVALYGALPSYYISEAEAAALGWKKWLGNLAEVLPGRGIGGKIYKNRDRRLPDVPGRIWHEADFDYERGFRNDRRLLYSNDGLLFVTYDHYTTFYEVGWENIL